MFELPSVPDTCLIYYRFLFCLCSIPVGLIYAGTYTRNIF